MIYEYNINHINTILGNKKKVLSHELLKTLLYFDIFYYPLSVKEIKRFCGIQITMEELENELGLIEKLGYVQHKGIFYSTCATDIDKLVERRVQGNIKALKMLKAAKRYSKLISYFPYVRGVYLSGSLSKGYADKKSDVDYFIITEPGRLWLCRMMLAVFKRVFLLNSHKYFCVNYFIDTESLEIPDKNIFTATELITLITTCNTALHRKLMQANPWVKEFFPNTLMESVSAQDMPANESWVKRLLEKFFSGKWGDKLDDICYEMTFAKWKKKFKKFSREEFELNLRSKKNVSKHHPRGFQAKVISLYREKIKDFEERYHINLS
jgi:predicted nucleotidyltransferase